MSFETEGIIFRQTRMVQGRRMILLFTKKYGKISVGSNVGDKGRSRTALALKPFTFGNYQIYEGRNYYELDRADAITSYYGIGEDLDRYAAGAFALELTEKVVPEGFPQPQVFDLLISFLEELEQRKRKHRTLLLAFEIKLLAILGVFPELDTCVSCGKTSFEPAALSVKDGGVLCKECASKRGAGDFDGSDVKSCESTVNIAPNGEEALIFQIGTDIINVVKYYARNPMRKFAGVALSDDIADRLQKILKAYLDYHFDLGDLKSEELFKEQ